MYSLLLFPIASRICFVSGIGISSACRVMALFLRVRPTQCGGAQLTLSACESGFLNAIL